jgi:hypothetical protein
MATLEVSLDSHELAGFQLQSFILSFVACNPMELKFKSYSLNKESSSNIDIEKNEDIYRFFCSFIQTTVNCSEADSKCNGIFHISSSPSLKLHSLPAKIVFKLWKSVAVKYDDKEDFTFVIQVN